MDTKDVEWLGVWHSIAELPVASAARLAATKLSEGTRREGGRGSGGGHMITSAAVSCLASTGYALTRVSQEAAWHFTINPGSFTEQEQQLLSIGEGVGVGGREEEVEVIYLIQFAIGRKMLGLTSTCVLFYCISCRECVAAP